jgi:hypothetical protein
MSSCCNIDVRPPGTTTRSLFFALWFSSIVCPWILCSILHTFCSRALEWLYHTCLIQSNTRLLSIQPDSCVWMGIPLTFTFSSIFLWITMYGGNALPPVVLHSITVQLCFSLLPILVTFLKHSCFQVHLRIHVFGWNAGTRGQLCLWECIILSSYASSRQ